MFGNWWFWLGDGLGYVVGPVLVTVGSAGVGDFGDLHIEIGFVVVITMCGNLLLTGLVFYGIFIVG